jgi:hypothetical protein
VVNVDEGNDEGVYDDVLGYEKIIINGGLFFTCPRDYSPSNQECISCDQSLIIGIASSI